MANVPIGLKYLKSGGSCVAEERRRDVIQNLYYLRTEFFVSCVSLSYVAGVFGVPVYPLFFPLSFFFFS